MADTESAWINSILDEVRPPSSLVHNSLLLDDSVSLTIDSRHPEPAILTLVDFIPEPDNIGVGQFWDGFHG